MLINFRLWNVRDQLVWAVLHKLRKREASTAIQFACLQTGTGGIHKGGNRMEDDWFLRQSTLHRFDRNQTGNFGLAGWGMQSGCPDFLSEKTNVLTNLAIFLQMPRGSDASWTEKLYSKCSKYSHFGKSRFGRSSFIVNHFADRVQYESNGFLEKNRDTVIEEQINVIKASGNSLLRRLFKPDDQKLQVPGAKLKVVSAKGDSGAKKSHKKSVGSQFRESLNALMSTLNVTTPHYIRCIKPNDTKAGFEFNPKRAVQQLRACGVLETIRISAAGKWLSWVISAKHMVSKLLLRFPKPLELPGLLLPLPRFVQIQRHHQKQHRKDLLQHFEPVHKELRQIPTGQNKNIFPRRSGGLFGEIAAGKTEGVLRPNPENRTRIYSEEKVPNDAKVGDTTANACQRLDGQKVFSPINPRSNKCWSFSFAFRKAKTIRTERAAITLQRYIRGYLARQIFQQKRRCILGLQSRIRGLLARKNYKIMKDNAKVCFILFVKSGKLLTKYELSYALNFEKICISLLL